MSEYGVEAIVSAQSTLEILSNQNDELKISENCLDSNYYVVQKSARVLRGMTWFGSVYNLFTKEPKLPVQSSRFGEIKFPPVKDYSRKKDELLAESKQPSFSEKKDIEEIKLIVDKLHNAATLISEELKDQDESLNRIVTKANKVNNATLAITIKATKLSLNKISNNFELVGTFEFIEPTLRMHLASINNMLTLVSHHSEVSINMNSTKFNCYTGDHDLVILQNVGTLKYLSIDFFGTLNIRSARGDTKNECCIVNLDGSPSGLLMISANWGNGGWLKAAGGTPSDNSNSSATSDTSHTTIIAVSQSIADTENIFTFRAVRII